MLFFVCVVPFVRNNISDVCRLKINTDINNLTNGLETYINESKDKEYTKAAQDILDNSKIIDDDEGR